MDLDTALAISARRMDVHAHRLRAIAEQLSGPAPAAPGPFAAAACVVEPACPFALRAALAADLQSLGSARATLGRTIELLR